MLILNSAFSTRAINNDEEADVNSYKKIHSFILLFTFAVSSLFPLNPTFARGSIEETSRRVCEQKGYESGALKACIEREKAKDVCSKEGLAGNSFQLCVQKKLKGESGEYKNMQPEEGVSHPIRD